LTADLRSGDEDREELCVDPTDMECGENEEVYSTTTVASIHAAWLEEQQNYAIRIVPVEKNTSGKPNNVNHFTCPSCR